MPEQKNPPRPHGDKLDNAIHDNSEQNRELSDRARGAGSDANGIPEFDEDDGGARRKRYDDGAKLVSGID